MKTLESLNKEGKLDYLIEVRDNIDKLVKIYNELTPVEKMQIKYVDAASKIDVSNVYVCNHDSSFVDLFRRKTYDWYSHKYWGETGELYISLSGEKIGMVKNDFGSETNIALYSRRDLRDKTYYTNCIINREVNFDNLRLEMYQKGLIGPYEMGKATEEEMLEVLKYAKEYFGLNKSSKTK